MESFVEVPGIDAIWRGRLVDAALARLDAAVPEGA